MGEWKVTQEEDSSNCVINLTLQQIDERGKDRRSPLYKIYIKRVLPKGKEKKRRKKNCCSMFSSCFSLDSSSSSDIQVNKLEKELNEIKKLNCLMLSLDRRVTNMETQRCRTKSPTRSPPPPPPPSFSPSPSPPRQSEIRSSPVVSYTIPSEAPLPEKKEFKEESVQVSEEPVAEPPTIEEPNVEEVREKAEEPVAVVKEPVEVVKEPVVAAKEGAAKKEDVDLLGCDKRIKACRPKNVVIDPRAEPIPEPELSEDDVVKEIVTVKGTEIGITKRVRTSIK